MKIESRDRSTILVHYYRAMVGRADVWRMRMDTTTNWAIGATAAVLSFTLGNSATPHYVVYISSILTLSFLFLEARRLTFYHLWQQRALLLEKGLIAPALHSGSTDSSAPQDELETALGPHLGTTIPTMSLTKAAARRLRRIYLYLFAVQLLAWLLKLSSIPAPAASLGELVSRADAGPIPGIMFFLAGGSGFLIAVVIAATRGGIDRAHAELDEP